jgi:hypothetical protein
LLKTIFTPSGRRVAIDEVFRCEWFKDVRVEKVAEAEISAEVVAKMQELNAFPTESLSVESIKAALEGTTRNQIAVSYRIVHAETARWRSHPKKRLADKNGKDEKCVLC